MQTRRTTLQSIAAAGVLATVPTPLSASRMAARMLDFDGVKAAPLPDQRLSIWLPPGYDASSKRYRVLYMHDAQNLFDPAVSNFNKVWAADTAMLGHAKATGEDPWVIVGIWSPGADRYRQYMPQPAYNAAGPDLQAQMDAFGNGKSIVSHAYIDWIAGTLKPWVDQHLRTQTGPQETAIIGSSMGGLISLYAFLEHPQIFGRAGCVSTHWPGTAPQEVGQTNAEMLGIWLDFIGERLGQPSNRKLWFDHGNATLDAHYPPYQAAIDAQIAATDWIRRQHWESRFYPGAEHEENAWKERLPDVLAWALA